MLGNPSEIFPDEVLRPEAGPDPPSVRQCTSNQLASSRHLSLRVNILGIERCSPLLVK